MRVPILGGAYYARSRIANAQRCINYYPELNQEDAPVPFTFYPRPGLRQLVQGNEHLPVRCLYRASNGNGYCVIGQKVYSISKTWVLTLLGSMLVYATTPCKMIDNGTTILVADGSTSGYEIVMATNAFSIVNDPTGAFVGANTLGYLDTFVVWNNPGTIDFGSTLSNVMTFDALYFAGKVGYPDPLMALSVNRREIFLLGQLKSEIWYDAGGATFPFALLPGAYIEHGCVATYSVATADIETFWLGQDLQGNGVVFALKAYDVRRISNHGIEYAIKQMQKSGVDISDAIGYTYQIEGHYFYVLTFPSGNQTWVYDASIDASKMSPWHQRCWTDANGNLNRDRTMSAAFINNTNVVGDWQNGKIYALDNDYYVDDASAIGADSISKIRSFPHFMRALDPTTGQIVDTAGKRIQYTNFVADIECGSVPLNADGTIGQISFRYSSDRGATWSTILLQDMGAPGQFGTYPTWKSLGLSRDMIFELSHSLAGPCALNGAFADAEVQLS